MTVELKKLLKLKPLFHSVDTTLCVNDLLFTITIYMFWLFIFFLPMGCHRLRLRKFSWPLALSVVDGTHNSFKIIVGPFPISERIVSEGTDWIWFTPEFIPRPPSTWNQNIRSLLTETILSRKSNPTSHKRLIRMWGRNGRRIAPSFEQIT
jgi:hypothetical protein